MSSVSETHNINTRASQTLNVSSPRPNIEFFKRSFAYHGPHVWNSLPDEVKSAENLNDMKRLYKRIMFWFYADFSDVRQPNHMLPYPLFWYLIRIIFISNCWAYRYLKLLFFILPNYLHFVCMFYGQTVIMSRLQPFLTCNFNVCILFLFLL